MKMFVTMNMTFEVNLESNQIDMLKMIVEDFLANQSAEIVDEIPAKNVKYEYNMNHWKIKEKIMKAFVKMEINFEVDLDCLKVSDIQSTVDGFLAKEVHDLIDEIQGQNVKVEYNMNH